MLWISIHDINNWQSWNLRLTFGKNVRLTAFRFVLYTFKHHSDSLQMILSFVNAECCQPALYQMSVYNPNADKRWDIPLNEYEFSFLRLGVLAPDGYCRPFDIDATGYTRSEAICLVFLQKAKDAKRIYSTVLYSKTNCDGECQVVNLSSTLSINDKKKLQKCA